MSLFRTTNEAGVTESKFAIGSGAFRHCFGGATMHSGAAFVGDNHTVDLLFLIDLKDPNVGLTHPNCDLLPLYYPLRYDGGELSYRVESNDKITIINQTKQPWSADWPYEGYPNPWPSRSIVVQQPFPLTDYLKDKDYDEWWKEEQESRRTAGKQIDHNDFIALVSGLHQGPQKRVCPVANCNEPMDIFCVIHNRPFCDDVNLWGEWGDCVDIVYYMCRVCSTIYTCNQCD